MNQNSWRRPGVDSHDDTKDVLLQGPRQSNAGRKHHMLHVEFHLLMQNHGQIQGATPHRRSRTSPEIMECVWEEKMDFTMGFTACYNHNFGDLLEKIKGSKKNHGDV